MGELTVLCPEHSFYINWVISGLGNAGSQMAHVQNRIAVCFHKWDLEILHCKWFMDSLSGLISRDHKQEIYKTKVLKHKKWHLIYILVYDSALIKWYSVQADKKIGVLLNQLWLNINDLFTIKHGLLCTKVIFYFIGRKQSTKKRS